ncbi:MAG: 50S ribosomal protein L10 [Phycisphaera sp.]|nr:50S ribosomal protein L10 [Phycisphaera sp.]
MSKPVKNLIETQYKTIFADLDGAVLIDIRGITSNDTNALRATLAQRGIRITVVKNSLAKRATTGTSLEKIGDLLEGASAVVYGGDSVVNVARELIEQAKTLPNLTFKGALMEGTLFKAEEIEALSKYPTREEAQAQALQLILSPGKNLVASILGPGKKIASLVKAIEEKLEKGEAIAKISA